MKNTKITDKIIYTCRDNTDNSITTPHDIYNTPTINNTTPIANNSITNNNDNSFLYIRDSPYKNIPSKIFKKPYFEENKINDKIYNKPISETKEFNNRNVNISKCYCTKCCKPFKNNMSDSLVRSNSLNTSVKSVLTDKTNIMRSSSLNMENMDCRIKKITKNDKETVFSVFDKISIKESVNLCKCKRSEVCSDYEVSIEGDENNGQFGKYRGLGNKYEDITLLGNSNNKCVDNTPLSKGSNKYTNNTPLDMNSYNRMHNTPLGKNTYNNMNNTPLLQPPTTTSNNTPHTSTDLNNTPHSPINIYSPGYPLMSPPVISLQHVHLLYENEIENTFFILKVHSENINWFLRKSIHQLRNIYKFPLFSVTENIENRLHRTKSIINILNTNYLPPHFYLSDLLSSYEIKEDFLVVKIQNKFSVFQPKILKNILLFMFNNKVVKAINLENRVYSECGNEIVIQDGNESIYIYTQTYEEKEWWMRRIEGIKREFI